MKILVALLGLVAAVFLAPGLFMLWSCLFGAVYTDSQAGAAFALGIVGLISGMLGAFIVAADGGY